MPDVNAPHRLDDNQVRDNQVRAAERLTDAVARWDECASLLSESEAEAASVLDEAEHALQGRGVRCIRVRGDAPGEPLGGTSGGTSGGLGLRELILQIAGRAPGLGGGEGLSDADLKAAVLRLAEPGPGRDRVALLISEAHRLPPASVRYVQLACRSSPVLRVVLAGQPGGVSAALAGAEFEELRRRITRKLDLSEMRAAAGGTPPAARAKAAEGKAAPGEAVLEKVAPKKDRAWPVVRLGLVISLVALIGLMVWRRLPAPPTVGGMGSAVVWRDPAPNPPGAMAETPPLAAEAAETPPFAAEAAETPPFAAEAAGSPPFAAEAAGPSLAEAETMPSAPASGAADPAVEAAPSARADVMPDAEPVGDAEVRDAETDVAGSAAPALTPPEEDAPEIAVESAGHGGAVTEPAAEPSAGPGAEREAEAGAAPETVDASDPAVVEVTAGEPPFVVAGPEAPPPVSAEAFAAVDAAAGQAADPPDLAAGAPAADPEDSLAAAAPVAESGAGQTEPPGQAAASPPEAVPVAAAPPADRPTPLPRSGPGAEPPPGFIALRPARVRERAAQPAAARAPAAPSPPISPPDSDNQRRCRDISLRAQLGRTPTDADIQFLRRGCRDK